MRGHGPAACGERCRSDGFLIYLVSVGGFSGQRPMRILPFVLSSALLTCSLNAAIILPTITLQRASQSSHATTFAQSATFEDWGSEGYGFRMYSVSNEASDYWTGSELFGNTYAYSESIGTDDLDDYPDFSDVPSPATEAVASASQTVNAYVGPLSLGDKTTQVTINLTFSGNVELNTEAREYADATNYSSLTFSFTLTAPAQYSITLGSSTPYLKFSDVYIEDVTPGRHWLYQGETEATLEPGTYDFYAMQYGYMQGEENFELSLTALPMPEPSIFMLTGLGLLFGMRRRR